MNIFFNQAEHPEVYKNQNTKANNQSFYKQDFLQQLLVEQKTASDTLHHSLNDFRDQFSHHEEIRSEQFNKLSSDLISLRKTQKMQEATFSNHLVSIAEQFNFLEKEHIKRDSEQNQQLLMVKNQLEEIIETMKKNEELYSELSNKINLQEQTGVHLLENIENQDTKHQQLMEKLDYQNELQSSIIEKIENYEGSQQLLLSKLEEQTEKMEEQTVVQTNLITKIDTQEALIDKLLRQLDHLRSIVFERTAFLAEKIENSYKKTSTHLSKWIKGSNDTTYYRLERNKDLENVEIMKDDVKSDR